VSNRLADTCSSFETAAMGALSHVALPMFGSDAGASIGRRGASRVGRARDMPIACGRRARPQRIR
jgi:hypothetical protein